MVRHQVLVLAFGGSNPSALAKVRPTRMSGFYFGSGEDSNATASGSQPPEARRPWEPGCSKSKVESLRPNISGYSAVVSPRASASRLMMASTMRSS